MKHPKRLQLQTTGLYVTTDRTFLVEARIEDRQRFWQIVNNRTGQRLKLCPSLKAARQAVLTLGA